MTDHEGPIHRAIVTYLRSVLPDGCMVHHSPNEGVRGGAKGRLDGIRRKDMGQLPGFPDLMLMTFCGVHFLEVKAEGGRLSPAQKEMHVALARLGFPVAVVRSVDDARQALMGWGIGTREIVPFRGSIS